MPRIICGSSYMNRYTLYENGRFRVVPSEEQIRDSIVWASSAGFAGIDMPALNDEHLVCSFSPRMVKGYREVAESNMISISSFSVRSPDVFPTADVRPTLKRTFRVSLEIAEGLGSRILAMKSPPYPDTTNSKLGAYPGGPPPPEVFEPTRDWKARWEDYVSYTGETCDIAREAGVSIAIEPRPREFIANTDAMIMLLDSVGSTNLKAVFDTGHSFATKETIPISIWRLGKRIATVHLTDNDGLIEQQWAAGEGRIEWPSVMEAFKRTGYDGDLAIDTSGAGVHAKEFLTAKAMIGQLVARAYGPQAISNEQRAQRRTG